MHIFLYNHVTGRTIELRQTRLPIKRSLFGDESEKLTLDLREIGKILQSPHYFMDSPLVGGVITLNNDLWEKGKEYTPAELDNKQIIVWPIPYGIVIRLNEYSYQQLLEMNPTIRNFELDIDKVIVDIAERRGIPRAVMDSDSIWKGLSLKIKLKILATTSLNTSNTLPLNLRQESPRALGLYRKAPPPLLPPQRDPESEEDSDDDINLMNF